MGKMITTDMICPAVSGSSVRRSIIAAYTSGVKNTTATLIATLSLGGRGRMTASSITSSRTSASREWGSDDMMMAASSISSTYI